MGKAHKIPTRDIALIGVMIATLEAAKLAMSYLPNVELVTLLIILYTLVFGRRILYVIPAFVLIEGCLYGFGIWWVMYLYVWPLLAGLTWLLRKNESVWFWSVFSGAFGLLFGAFCAIPYFFVGGAKAAFTWWVAGIPYDLIHCAANATLCVVLFTPLRRVLRQLEQKF